MAATESIVFDAVASNIDGTDPGSPLTVGWGTNYRLFEHEYPAPPQNVLYSSSIDTEGELPVSSRYGNRTITLRFKLVDPTGSLRTALQAKFAKLQSEGGTLKRTMADGAVRIYDVVAGDGWNPSYDFNYYIANLTIVEMSLPARPFSRGAEVDLGDNVETTLPVLIFTDTGVTGDAPALGRLVIDNDDASNAQALLRWGLQSRYYSAASTAALFYQAESCALLNATAAVGPAGASGAGSNTAFYGSLGVGGQTPLFYLGASATAQTHVGTFRVIARVRAPAANAGIVSLRIAWAPTPGGALTVNDPVSVPAEDIWYLVDLGQVLLPPVKSGTQGWLGYLAGGSTVSLDDIYTDWIAFIPVDEGSGENVDPTSSPQILASGGATIRWNGAVVNGTYNPRLSYYEGDYLLVPPSGAENRTVRVIVKLARGDVTVGVPTGTSEAFPDPGIDDISARLFVTPRYLT